MYENKQIEREIMQWRLLLLVSVPVFPKILVLGIHLIIIFNNSSQIFKNNPTFNLNYFLGGSSNIQHCRFCFFWWEWETGQCSGGRVKISQAALFEKKRQDCSSAKVIICLLYPSCKMVSEVITTINYDSFIIDHRRL